MCRRKEIDACDCALDSKHCKTQAARRSAWFKYLSEGNIDKMIELIIETEMHKKSCSSELDPSRNEYLKSHPDLLSTLPSTYDFMKILDESNCATLQCAVKSANHDVLNFILDLLKLLNDGRVILNAGSLNDRTTALMDACSIGDITMVKALHAAGANWFLKNSSGQQACQIAEKAGHSEITDFFHKTVESAMKK